MSDCVICFVKFLLVWVAACFSSRTGYRQMTTVFSPLCTTIREISSSKVWRHSKCSLYELQSTVIFLQLAVDRMINFKVLLLLFLMTLIIIVLFALLHATVHNHKPVTSDIRCCWLFITTSRRGVGLLQRVSVGWWSRCNRVTVSSLSKDFLELNWW